MANPVLVPTVQIETIGDDPVTLPRRATDGAAGYDVCSREHRVLEPGAYATVGTGFRLGIPEGFEAQVRPRSGLAAKHGVTVLNAPGTIDSDYRGEVGIILINHGRQAFTIEPGMRIAQLIFAPVTTVVFQSQKLETTRRGEGGFGSTGHEPIKE
jgi:dUTP pyrophosphatase